VHSRQIEIDYRYVGPSVADFPQRGIPVRYAGHYFVAFGVRKNRGQTVSAESVFIRQKYRYFRWSWHGRADTV
jgi:hypothetical protein